MAFLETAADSAGTLLIVQRLRRHHDHLKNLDAEYALMRHTETYKHMIDPCFKCDVDKMEALSSRHFTSLILKLSEEDGKDFFSRVREAYARLEALVTQFDPCAAVEIYFDSA
jgi:hypothetical protein